MKRGTEIRQSWDNNDCRTNLVIIQNARAVVPAMRDLERESAMARVQRENLKQAILDAAENRLWRHGIRKMTIDDIAADAGVGKGTVYLYFDSKEAIACALVAKYKEAVLADQELTARDRKLPVCERIRQMIKHPVMAAHARCGQYPEAVEVIATVKPRFAKMMRPYFMQEIALIAEVIEEGNHAGRFAVEDSLTAARSLKLASLAFMPPYPCVEDRSSIESELDLVIDMGLRSFRPAAPVADEQNR
ncbi:MAG: helix-turn-helix domain containing protein [Capsulimonadaceae bacterium]|nr:helix-turn-helix domain containing protein [Capsulimonadaceae bacterium]